MADDGTVIGLGNVFPETPENDDSAEIAVLVEDSHQGQGVGTALLRRQLQVAEQMGFSQVMAMVLSENRAMTRMLARTGLDWTTKIEVGSSTMRAKLVNTGSTQDEHLSLRHRDSAGAGQGPPQPGRASSNPRGGEPA